MTPRHLAGYLEASAARDPDRLAVVDANGCSATYAQLNRQADALAAFLVARGVTRGDRVGLVLPKGIPAVVALFGAMKAGAAYVPVDHASPVERIRRILADCRIRALVIDDRALDGIPDPGDTDIPSGAVIVVPTKTLQETARRETTRFDRALEAGKDPPEGWSPERRPADLAYILYTSGSTGAPKGVMISHENVVSFIDWCSSVFEPAPGDRFGNHAPFHFDASVLDLYLGIRHGATVHLISDDLGRNPPELARYIATHRLTVWFSTPRILTLLAQFGHLEAHDASSLRLVLFGGEIFPIKHLRALQRHWPSPVYYNLYGPTETTVACTFARLPPHIPDDRDTPYPIGVPCSHCRAVVLDETGREVAPGGQGLLYISGPSLFAGYWDRPAESAAAFLDRDGVRWYNTGDVVREDPLEGFIYIGRNDRMVKRRGYRIELGEIECTLYAHARLREAAVVSIPDIDSGVRVIAFVSSHEAKPPSTIELKTFCSTKLPGYMAPDQFVFRDRLPRTSSDKVDYQVLLAQLLSPA